MDFWRAFLLQELYIDATAMHVMYCDVFFENSYRLEEKDII